MKKDRYSIVVADDHGVVREGVTLILNNNFFKIKLQGAADIPQLLTILKNNKTDLILLDIRIPGGNSPEMIQRIRTVQQDVKILIFSMLDEKYHALQYIRAGANGYLNKNEDESTIVEVVKKILESGHYASPLLKEMIVDNTFDTGSNNIFETLSKREFQVAGLLVDGLGNTEIANHMKIHASTVSTYKKRIYEKLEINNLPHLIELFNHYC